MNRYEVFGENLITERKSVIYEANSPEEAIAMARRDIENHTYFFSDWEFESCSNETTVKFTGASLIK